MQIGFVGSGNMARAIALGLAEPALFADGGSGRAAELAEEIGGGTASAAEIAGSCELIFLAHKPAQLETVAAELQATDATVVSMLAQVPLERLRTDLPQAKLVRVMPNIPAELGSGVIGVAAGSELQPAVRALLGRLGTLIVVDEAQLEVLTAVAGCAPAFFAVFAGALVESAAAHGMNRSDAVQAVVETMAGTADVLRATDGDHTALARRVASPGGLTERALQSLAADGLEAAVERAVETVLGR